MQYNPTNIDGWVNHRIVVNSSFNWGVSLESLNEKIYNQYIDDVLASKNLSQLVWHEMGHLLSFAKCDRWTILERVEEELKERFVKGISGYADERYDGSESLAEAFVRYLNGEELSDDALKLLDDYVFIHKKGE